MSTSDGRQRGLRALWIFAYLVFLLFLAEGVAQSVYFTRTHVWPFADPGSPNTAIFEPHPYLVGTPRPGAVVARDGRVVSIDSLGFRGADIATKKSDSVLRVLALGSSETFGVGVTDADTWPINLERRLDSALSKSGGRYRKAEVINAGVPGYSTLESLISFESRGIFLRPDVVVLYQGISDLRSGHSPGFRTDYSNFHAITQPGNLGLTGLRRWNRIGLARFGWALVSRVFRPAVREGVGPRVAGVDERARQVFESNLRAFAALCHGFGVRCLLVPQAFSQDFPPDEYWLRYLDTKSLPAVVAAYDSTMAAVAKSAEVRFAQAVLDAPWTRSDFRDYAHFNNQGSAKFATLILTDVLALGPPDSVFQRGKTAR